MKLQAEKEFQYFDPPLESFSRGKYTPPNGLINYSCIASDLNARNVSDVL